MIRDARGHTVWLSGVNWSSLETWSMLVPKANSSHSHVQSGAARTRDRCTSPLSVYEGERLPGHGAHDAALVLAQERGQGEGTDLATARAATATALAAELSAVTRAWVRIDAR
jgi:hypothetical protein